MARKRRKKKLAPGLRTLRRRLPDRRARESVVVVTEPEPGPGPVVSEAALVARKGAKKELPTPVDYGPDISTLADAVLALGDRVDAQIKKVPQKSPAQTDYSSDIQRLNDAVLALGDRVDAQTRKVPPSQKDFDPELQVLSDAVLALGDRVDQMARRQE